MGTTGPKSLKAQCGKNFSCKPGATDCCCRQILYNQPDFMNVPSILETKCKAQGFKVLFLPKFHCQLNFIEQCWGFTKRRYRLLPPSSKEDVLERNLINSLEEVTVIQM
jgi:transposase